MTVPVRYALPGRQIAVSLALVFAATGAVIGLAFVLPPAAAIPAAFAVLGLMVWLMVKSIAATGDAILTDKGLVLEPRRGSLCAPGGPIHIPWEEIVSVRDGDTNAARPFVMLRTENPQRSWIISVVNRADTALHGALLERVNAARALRTAEPLECRRFYDSPGWRFAAWLSLVLLAAAIIATLAAGEGGGWKLWRPVIMLTCFAVPFATTVLGARRRG